MSPPRHFLVTGGTGFLGSALVRRLVRDGHRVCVLDNNWRGSSSRLADVRDRVEFIDGDIRDSDAVRRAVQGVDSVCHLAGVNGTEHFYTRPDLVLDVGVRGMINLLDALAGSGVRDLFVASSSEVYQSPKRIPTDEMAPLSLPDPLNPRYSYAGAKMVTELMALHSATRLVERVVVFRPHNIYGPDMGTQHVIPEFAIRMTQLASKSDGVIDFPIEGTGEETRAFGFVDDFIDGLIRLIERGQHRLIYHLGSDEETRIAALAQEIARCFGREIRVVPGTAKEGSPQRRCPDISRLRALGFGPRISLREGLEKTVRWYRDNVDGYRDARRAA